MHMKLAHHARNKSTTGAYRLRFMSLSVFFLMPYVSAVEKSFSGGIDVNTAALIDIKGVWAHCKNRYSLSCSGQLLYTVPKIQIKYPRNESGRPRSLSTIHVFYLSRNRWAGAEKSATLITDFPLPLTNLKQANTGTILLLPFLPCWCSIFKTNDNTMMKNLSSQPSRGWDRAKWLKCLTTNAKAATVPIFKRSWNPGIDSKEWIPPGLCSLAGRYENPTRFLAPINCLQIPAL